MADMAEHDRAHCRSPMKTSLDHLPPAKQRELEHIKSVFMREFEAAIPAVRSPGAGTGKSSS